METHVKNFVRRTALGVMAAALFTTAAGAWAQAATSPSDTPGYPVRPIRILVGFPPGASTDAIARYLADMLSRALNNPVIVENRAGAGGNVAAEATKNAQPDGYTLLLAIAGHVTNRGLYKSLPYEPIRDFAPINLVARIPFMLVASNNFPGNSVAEVIAMSKAKPGSLDYGTSGVGSSQHLSGAYFAKVTGINWVHVPYKGGAPALLALASNEIPLALLSTTLSMPMLQKGSIKPIAVAAPRRSPLLPNVPTFSESGLPGFTADTWYGLLAPAGTPTPIINRLNAEISRGLASKEFADKFASQDAYIINSGPAEFAKVIREDDAKWFDIVREAKIQAE